MDGDRTVDFAPAPEKAPERELDFSRIAIGLRHPRENLGGMVESVVDEVIEADVVVTRQAHGTRGTVAAA
jgi:hypothetical protein